MAILTGERVFGKTQEGVESTPGTPVATTAMLNMETGSIPELDRAEGAPQEDYGTISDRQTGRAYYGVRLMKVPAKGVVRFEDIMRYLEPGLAGGVSPSVPEAGSYLWTYTADDTTDTVKSRTLKFGDQINVYSSAYCLAEKIHLYYDALATGSNAPWKIDVDYFGQDLAGGASFDVVTAVSGAESPMGHLTRIYFGSTSTVFNSLSEVTGSLVKFDMTIDTGIVTRKWGGATDTFSAHGRTNRKIEFTATVFATAAGYTAYYSPWQNTALITALEKRMRIQAVGSIIGATTKYRTLTIDGRIQAKLVKLADHNGGAIFEISGSYTDDATLASNIQIAVQNGVAALT